MLLCGMDEAGRGPFAGPLVAAAVIFPPTFVFAEAFPKLPLRDSKKLSMRQREVLIEKIISAALTWKVEKITVAEINELGLGWANRAVFERLIGALEADLYIVDGNLKLADVGEKRPKVRCVVRADETDQTVSAASVIAKVTRDRIMHELHREYPQYGWIHNHGYGTPDHIAALRRYGATPHHRVQFVTTALSKPLPGMETIDQ